MPAPESPLLLLLLFFESIIVGLLVHQRTLPTLFNEWTLFEPKHILQLHPSLSLENFTIPSKTFSINNYVN